VKNLQLLIVLIALICLCSWIANIVKFCGLFGGEVTQMFIARGIGIVFAPLGAVLGFF